MTKALPLLLLLVGCVPSEIEEKDFPKYGSKALCSLERECDKGNWLNQYSGQGDCQAHWEQALIELVELYDDLDCDYSKSEAGKAYEDVTSMSCEEWYEDVYVNPLGVLEDVWGECQGFNPFPTTYYGSGQ